MTTTAGTAKDLPVDEPFPGIMRSVLDGHHATLTEYRFAAGARFPLHRHPQEQLTTVLDGSVHATVEDRTIVLEAGDWFVVEGGVAHGIVGGPGGARILAVIAPARAPSEAFDVLVQA